MKSQGNLKEIKPLSKDLTVVLIRGNGTPRSFRIPVPELQRSILTLSTTLLFLVVALVAAVSVSIYEKKHHNTVITPSSYTAPVAQSQSAAPSSATADTSEQAKELIGLHEDIAKLHTQLDQRQSLPVTSNNHLQLQFLSPRNTAVSDAEALIKIQNPHVRREGKDVYLDFELHNIDEGQKQVRGYIVAIAKTPNFLYGYPEGVLSPKDNIILNFAHGETFAISRFRAAQAQFKNLPSDVGNIGYQILLFESSGRLLNSLYLEDNK